MSASAYRSLFISPLVPSDVMTYPKLRIYSSHHQGSPRSAATVVMAGKTLSSKRNFGSETLAVLLSTVSVFTVQLIMTFVSFSPKTGATAVTHLN